MSIEHILQRHTTTVATPDPGPANNVEAIEDLGCFGLMRGHRDRAVSLELRKKDDTVLAVPYALIEQFLYSPTDGITVRAAGREIRVRGRGLNDASPDRSVTLFGALARHRVLWVAEKTRATNLPTTGSTTVIESVTW